MNSVERVKNICKERNIPIYKIEKDLGFSNGYISQLRKGVFPDDRLKKIADYLNVTINYLATGEPEEPQVHTIAAHHDEEEWTDEELSEIEEFKKYVLSKRNK